MSHSADPKTTSEYVAELTTLVVVALRHVLHASDADQAEELLMIWSAEGVGKVPGTSLTLVLRTRSDVILMDIDVLSDREWATTIKGAIQARAKHRQTIAIAQVQAAIHQDTFVPRCSILSLRRS